MTPIVSVQSTTCPDPECIDGVILVNNVYNVDPLTPTEQPCDLCEGKGYIVFTKTLED